MPKLLKANSNPLQSEWENIHACQSDLDATINELKAINDRIEANAQADKSAREKLEQAQRRAQSPASLEVMDAEMAIIEDAERTIADTERQRRPLQRLAETAGGRVCSCREDLRDAKKALFKAAFEARKEALQPLMPAADALLEAFGMWDRSGVRVREGDRWQAFLADLLPMSREKLNAANDNAPGLIGLSTVSN